MFSNLFLLFQDAADAAAKGPDTNIISILIKGGPIGIAIAIVLLINFSSQDFYILIPGIIIIAREVLVSGLREFLAGLNVSVPVSKLAKYKTAFQMISITGLLLGENGSSYTIDYFSSGLNEMGLRFIIIDFIVYASKILFAFSSILTVVTGFVYFRVGLKEM